MLPCFTSSFREVIVFTVSFLIYALKIVYLAPAFSQVTRLYSKPVLFCIHNGNIFVFFSPTVYVYFCLCCSIQWCWQFNVTLFTRFASVALLARMWAAPRLFRYNLRWFTILFMVCSHNSWPKIIYTKLSERSIYVMKWKLLTVPSIDILRARYNVDLALIRIIITYHKLIANIIIIIITT